MRIQELLAQEEGKRLDFKRNLSSLEPVLRDIIAFANSAGGTIVVGVRDQKRAPGKAASERVEGLTDPYADEEKLMDAIADNIAPLIRVELQVTTFNDRTLLIVEVPHQLGPVYLRSKGEEEGAFVRLGSTNRVADRARLEELRSAASTRTWDERAHGSAQRDDLDDALAAELFDAQGAGRVTDGVLRTHRLLVGDADSLQPSNAGLILFAKELSACFPDARFRCITYPGATKSTGAMDDVDFAGQTVLEALDDVLEYIRTHTSTLRDIQGMKRSEIPMYSEVMIREIVINAMAHADYNLTGTPLRVSIYSNRLEIQNPGTFPPGVSIEDLKDGVSIVRNRAIAKTLHTLGFMEQQGTAWARIQEAVAEGYPEPEWREAGPTMLVTLFPHEAVIPSDKPPEGINEGITADEGEGPKHSAKERRQWILAAIDSRSGITVPEIRAGLKVSQSTAERDIAALRKAREIERVGSRKTGKYQRKA